MIKSFTVINIMFLILLLSLLITNPAIAQSNNQWSPNYWSNNMKNNFFNNGEQRNRQNGINNFFQDAKGFYKLIGNGDNNTKVKFYFDVDFQLQMDAWMKSQGKSDYNNRVRQQHKAYQDYLYRQGYYQNYYPGYNQQYQAQPPYSN